MEEENRRGGVAWQNFDISLSVPEPSYDEEQRWFKIDDDSMSDPNAWTPGKTFFCAHCEREKDASVFCKDDTSFKSDCPQSPDRCIGCTYKYALHNTYYRVNDYKGLRENETYALACARYIYVQHFADV